MKLGKYSLPTVVALALSSTLHADTGAYSGKTSELQLPDISLVGDFRYRATDRDEDPNNEKFRVHEVEFMMSGDITPNLRGDFVLAYEGEYEDDGSVENEVHVEEAYATFHSLPGGFEIIAGRKFMDFGRLNPVHSHDWAFADQPLALLNLFGDHSWADDGIQVSWLAPLPGDFYLRLGATFSNGNEIGHDHEHGGGDSHGSGDSHSAGDSHGGGDSHSHLYPGDETIEWDGEVYTLRAALDIPVTEAFSTQLGLNYAGDTDGSNDVFLVDFLLRKQWEGSYKQIVWHTEWMQLDDSERDTQPDGFFSYIAFRASKKWEFGVRYDDTSLIEDDDLRVQGATGFVTYEIAHDTNIRGQLQQFTGDEGFEDETRGILQFVVAIGPHTHSFED